MTLLRLVLLATGLSTLGACKTTEGASASGSSVKSTPDGGEPSPPATNPQEQDMALFIPALY